MAQLALLLDRLLKAFFTTLEKEGFTIILLVLMVSGLAVNQYAMYDKMGTRNDTLTNKVEALQLMFLRCSMEKNTLYQDKIRSINQIDSLKKLNEKLGNQIDILKDRRHEPQ